MFELLNQFWANFINVFPSILIFIVVLLVLVLIHEFGHFIAAKIFKIKVEEFSFGFPPKVIGKKIGETTYLINLLPIGGYVKLYGEDDAGAGKISKTKEVTKDLHRAFFSRPAWQRITVIVAGVAMNFFLAVAIATYFISTQGYPVDTKTVVISEVNANSPAEAAGIQVGDIVRSVDQTVVEDTNTLITLTGEKKGDVVELIIVRNDQEITTALTPRVDPPEGEGAMGIAVDQNIIIEQHPFPISLYYGTKQALNDLVLIAEGIVDIFRTLFVGKEVPEGVAGPVGIAQLTHEFVQINPILILNLVYMLSLVLALVNILPIPGLDGGRLFFILIEVVTRRKVNPKYEAYAHMVGIILLLALIVLISINDIGRLVSGQSILPQ